MNKLILLLLVCLLGACKDSNSTNAVNTTETAAPIANTPAPINPPKATPVSTTPAESPNIQIKIAGANPGGLVRLIGMFTEQQYLADSARINANGEVVLTNSIKNGEPYKAGLLFLALQQGGSIQMLIDKDQTFSMSTHVNNLVGSMEVKGSLDNEILYGSLKSEQAQQERINAFSQQMNGVTKDGPEYNKIKDQRTAVIAERKAALNNLFQQHPTSFFTSFKRAGQNPEVRDIRNPDGSANNIAQVSAYRKEFWDGVDFGDERLLYTPVITNKLKRYISELTPQHQDSIISAASFLVNKSMPYKEYFKYFANRITLMYDPKETTLMDPQAVYTYMVQNYFTQERAFWSTPAEIKALQNRAYEMAASIVGKKGPNVTAKDPSGQMQSIYDKKAPYVIVYLYNPDCEHCQEQTPKLVNFYNQWKSKGVDVYAIVVDTDDKRWKEYIAKTGMTFTNVHDPTNRAIYATYYVDQTPELYVLNPDRIIIGKNLKVNQIETIIERDKAK